MPETNEELRALIIQNRCEYQGITPEELYERDMEIMTRQINMAEEDGHPFTKGTIKMMRDYVNIAHGKNI